MLRERLNQALKDAMRAKEPRKVSTLRLILAAVKDRDIAMRADPDERDDDVILQEILAKMIKQRQDSIQAYEEAGRCELAEKEREEIRVIEAFLPRQLSETEIRQACEAVVDEVQAASLKDIGRCMGALKSRYAGRMDFSKASQQVKGLLGQRA